MFDNIHRCIQAEKISRMIGYYENGLELALQGELRKLWEFAAALDLPEAFRMNLEDLIVKQSKMER